METSKKLRNETLEQLIGAARANSQTSCCVPLADCTGYIRDAYVCGIEQAVEDNGARWWAGFEECQFRMKNEMLLVGSEAYLRGAQELAEYLLADDGAAIFDADTGIEYVINNWLSEHTKQPEPEHKHTFKNTCWTPENEHTKQAEPTIPADKVSVDRKVMEDILQLIIATERMPFRDGAVAVLQAVLRGE